MNAMDDLDDRDLRRRQLAKRLVAHQARTQTIYDFTGYTARRQSRLRQRWGVPEKTRHRGPAPTSYAFCFETLRARAEATSALIFSSLFGAVPPRFSDSTSGYSSLETGEKLCESYEAFRACFPTTSIEFEQFKLLACGLWSGEVLQLSGCETCPAVTLIDLLAKRRSVCTACRRRELNGVPDTCDAGDDAVKLERGQVELF